MTPNEPDAPRDHPTVSVLGVHVSAVRMDDAVRTILGWVRARHRTYVTVTGVHGVMECQRSPELLGIHNAAGMVTPDGMPMVWSCRAAGIPETTRVYGPDLVTELARSGARDGLSFYCLGGMDGVARDLGEVLVESNPGVRLAGEHSPPFSPSVELLPQDTIDEINASGADVLLVGLSTPKQERWMALHRPLLDVPVLIGVGAAFDLLTGRLRQAPSVFQRTGLEWLFRLLMEPRRLAGRYLRNNPAFLWRIARDRPTVVTTSR